MPSWTPAAILPAALRPHADFARLWLARVCGGSAQQLLMMAVGWHLYDLTRSAWDLGLIGLLQFLPSLVLVLPAGEVVDRVRRSRLLALCWTVLLAIALLLMALPALPLPPRATLLGLSVLLGIVRAFQMPAQQAIVARLVPAPVLPTALAFSSASNQAAIVLAPALGGFVYAVGPAHAFALCALLFAIAAWTCAAIAGDRVVPGAVPPAAPGTGLRQRLAFMLAGFGYVRAQPVLLGAISLDMFAVLLGGATALLPIYAKDILHVGPWGLGLLRSAPAIGAVAMSIALIRRPLQRRAGPRLLTAVAAFGAATVVFGLSTNFALSMGALVVLGAADMVSVVIRQTLVQLQTPDAMRGRVSAVSSLFIGASNQLGEFESGATAAWFGTVESVVAGGIGAIALALAWTRLFPAVAARDALVAHGATAVVGPGRPAGTS